MARKVEGGWETPVVEDGVVQNPEEMREAGKRDLYFFAKYILGYKLMEEVPHRELTELLMDFSILRILLLWPRGTFKSTVATVSYPLWRLVHNPDLRFTIDNETEKKAALFVDEIKTHCERNALFRDLYGDLVGDERWRSGDIIVKRKIHTKDSSVSSTGTDAATTGLHCDELICDDLVGPTNVKTPTQRGNVLEHWKTLIPLMNPGSRLIVPGTRWDLDDLYNYLIEELADLFHITIKKAVQDDGTLFFPTRLNAEELSMRKRTMGAVLYAANYQNDPMPAEKSFFNESWNRFYNFSKLRMFDPDHNRRRDAWRIGMVADPAIGQSRGSDYCSFGVAAITPAPKKKIIWLQCTRYRMTTGEFIRMLYDLNEEWRPDIIAIEEVAFQQLYKPLIAHEALRRREVGYARPDLPLLDEGLRPRYKEQKHDRITVYSGVLERGDVFFPDNGMCDDLLREQRTYAGPGSIPHDDCLDVAGYMMREEVLAPNLPHVMETEDDRQRQVYEEFLVRLRGQGHMTPGLSRTGTGLLVAG